MARLKLGTTIDGEKVPVSNGIMQQNLNAELLDGKKASDFSAVDHTHPGINQDLLTSSTVQFKRIGVGTSSPNEDVDIAGNARIRGENSLKFGGVGANDNKFEIKYNESTKSIDFNFF